MSDGGAHGNQVQNIASFGSGCWLSSWTSLPAGSAQWWLLALFLDNIISSMLCALWLLFALVHGVANWLCKSTRSDVFQGCFGGVTTHRLILPVFGETLDLFDEACGLLTEMSGGAKVI